MIKMILYASFPILIAFDLLNMGNHLSGFVPLCLCGFLQICPP